MSLAVKAEHKLQTVVPPAPSLPVSEQLAAIPMHAHLAADDQYAIRTISGFRRARTLVGRDVDYGALAVEMIALSSLERCFAAFESMTCSKTAAEIVFLIHDRAKHSPWSEDPAHLIMTNEQIANAFNNAQDYRDYLQKFRTWERRIVYSLIMTGIIFLIWLNYM